MGMALTNDRGKMGGVVVGPILSELIAEIGAKISARMLLEQIVQLDGVIYSVCVRHNRDSWILCQCTYQVRTLSL
jgi:hypothetical protein